MTDTADRDQRLAELERRLSQAVGLLERLATVVTGLTELWSSADLVEVLSALLSESTALVSAEASSLLLLSDDDKLTFAVVDGEKGPLLSDKYVPAGRGVAGWVLEHREAAVVNDAETDELFFSGVDTATRFTTRNLMAVPLFLQGRAVGVIEMINKVDGDGFDELDVAMGTALASLASLAIDYADVYEQLGDPPNAEQPEP